MDTIIYYSEMEGISLGTFKNVPVVMICVPIIFIMNTRFTFSQKESASFSSNNRAYQVKKGSLILVDTNLIHMTHAPEDDTTGYTRIILYIDKFKMQQFDEKFPHLNLVPFFANTMEFII
mgnify:CR=1 FL=1